MLRRSGRRTARYPENADVHGKLRADRFDLPAAPAVKLSESDQARESYAAMGSERADQLMGYLVSTIQPATARAGDGQNRDKLSNVLWSDALAGEAAQCLGYPVSIRQMNGALLAAGYWPVRGTRQGAVWAVGAKGKDS
jgi:hypothetical protein